MTTVFFNGMPLFFCGDKIFLKGSSVSVTFKNVDMMVDTLTNKEELNNESYKL